MTASVGSITAHLSLDKARAAEAQTTTALGWEVRADAPGIPAKVSREAQRRAIRQCMTALGIDAPRVTGIRVSFNEGIEITQNVVDDDGNILVRGCSKVHVTHKIEVA